MSTTTVAGSNTIPAEVLAAVNPKKTSEDSLVDVTENRFLKLLTTQLKNQDPLNPLDNAQMTSQMAQISTVNGIEKLNATLEKMMASSNDSQAVQAAGMLGHQVFVAGNGLSLSSGGQAAAGIEVPQAVDNLTVTITDGNGGVVRTLSLGAQSAGLLTFGWDGKNDAGTPVAAGRYSFAVAADQNGKAVSGTKYELAPVTGILRDKNGVRIELGQLGDYAMSDIRQIF